MTEPIYANDEHRVIIETYITMCQEFAKEVSTKSKYNNYLEVVQIIIDYHNGYGEGTKEENFWDWLTIIPINLAVATNGFFAGVETKGNSAVVRAYRIVLDELTQDTVDKIDKIELINE
jgi:hypothetical protein|tara:strand:- start:315 stop:671 length:357 start_codon:yes stop_codon:yes gene_type:complete